MFDDGFQIVQVFIVMTYYWHISIFFTPKVWDLLS